MSSLMELIQTANEIAQKLFDSEGEIGTELEAMLNTNTLELKTKIDGYAAVLEQMELRKTYAVEKMKAWSAIAKRCEAITENMESRLLYAMKSLGTDAVHGLETSVVIQQNPPRAEVVDEVILDGEYFIYETTKKIDKRKLLERLKQGPVAGAELARGERLKFKPSERKALK